VRARLEADGWIVTDYAAVRATELNVDLRATRPGGGRTFYLQVHACNNLGWISAGEVSASTIRCCTR